jgi:uncharacterized protein YbjT (DUF2867 family)
MAILSNVVIVGASGNIGKPVLSALITDPDLSVTILARPDSKILSNPPAGAKVVTADFNDHAALVSALKGADALVLTVSQEALQGQASFIKAAVEAGVKRVIPSEFGADLNNPNTGGLAVFRDKIQVRKLLEQLASDGKITWTAVANGPFLDWGLEVGFIGPDIKAKTAILYDGGDRHFSATLLDDVAKSVVGILKHPEETKNKPIYVHSVRLTLKQLVAIYEKILGVKIETTVVSTADVERKANEKIAKGDFSGFVETLYRAIFGEGYGGDFEGRVSNELVGVQLLDEAGLEELVKKYVQ